MDYFITNLAISTLMLATVKLLHKAPAKLQLSLLLLALFCWFIPWHVVEFFILQPSVLLPDTFTFDFFADDLGSNKGEAVNVINTTMAKPTLWQNMFGHHIWQSIYLFMAQLYQNVNFTTLLIGLTTFGFVLFLADVFRYRGYIAHLNSSSKNGDELLNHALFKYLQINKKTRNSNFPFSRNIQVKITDETQPGMATGFLSPTIWLNQAFFRSKHCDTILLHELTHIRFRDPIIKWATTLAKRLFWWNPFVRVLVKKLELLIELRCDQYCYQVKKEQYSVDLAEILLHQHKGTDFQVKNNMNESYAGIATIHQHPSINVTRLKLLEQERIMKPSYLILTVVSIVISTFTCAQINNSTNNFQKGSIESSATSKLHKSALKMKAVRANKKPMVIYLPDQPENALYNRQIKQLVKLSAPALSADLSELDRTYHAITAWNDNRQVLSEKQERLFAFKLLSIQHFLLQQQGKTTQIIELILQQYSTIAQVPKFYRHHLAKAYLLLEDPEQALRVIQPIIDVEGKILSGSVQLSVEVYLANHRYEQALALVEEQLSLAENNSHLLQLKYGVLLAAGNNGAAEQVAELLTAKGQKPKTFSSGKNNMAWSPILDHI